MARVRYLLVSMLKSLIFLKKADRRTLTGIEAELTSSDDRRRFILGEVFDWLMLFAATVQHHRVKSFITILFRLFQKGIF